MAKFYKAVVTAPTLLFLAAVYLPSIAPWYLWLHAFLLNAINEQRTLWKVFNAFLKNTVNWLKNIFFKFIDFTDRNGGRERERETSICCSTYFCIHWLILACALTRDQTHTLLKGSFYRILLCIMHTHVFGANFQEKKSLFILIF